MGKKKNLRSYPSLNAHLQVDVSTAFQDFIKCFCYSLWGYNNMTVPPVIQPSSIKLRINLKGGREKEEGKNIKRVQEQSELWLGLLSARDKKVPWIVLTIFKLL